MSVSIPASGTMTMPAPFDAVAGRYDQNFTNSLIGTAQRKQVWQELDRVFAPGQRVLEINCGTGVDAVHLADRGVEVWACDNSTQMLDVARCRVTSSSLAAGIHLCRVAIEQIQSLQSGVVFDGAFSNFGGLNCVEDLSAVARNLSLLLKPGAPLTLCVMSRHVAWEMIWFAVRGPVRQAIRRLGRQPVQVKLGQGSIPCWYRSVREIRRAFRPYFRLRRWKGVGVSLPPSYLENWAAQVPRVMRILEAADPYLGRTPLARCLADHLLLTFERC
jgi:ubiquinone/menaquinone biosynthesis C-methylase UbiE